jgi:VCBS repeat-containing protein
MTTTVNTINGNEGNNRLTGTSRNDVINGNGGNDRLNGGAGADILNGGAGKDELNGGSGNDVLDGGSGSDELEGGSGNDTLIYTLAENNVIGRTTYDEYDGGSGSDTLELRFTRAEWMNEDNQKMLQSYLKWASKSGSGCRWDDDFTFRFGNARLEIEDIEKLVVKVDDAEIINAGRNGVTVVDDRITITEDEAGVQTIDVLDNDIVWDLVKNLELLSNPTNISIELVKPSDDDASTWYFKYTPDSTVYQSLKAGESREQTFTYRVTDANGDANKEPAKVTITITGLDDVVNTKPVIEGKGRVANVKELINLNYENSTIKSYADKADQGELGSEYNYLHERTGQFYVKDAEDSIELVANDYVIDGYLGKFTPIFTGIKNPDGKYLVTWEYKVKDRDLDPLMAATTGTHSKDQTYTLNFKSGADTLSADVVIHLDGRDELTFIDGKNEENNIILRQNGSDGEYENPGNDIIYLGEGYDEAYAENGGDVIYGGNGGGSFLLIADDSVFFGGDGIDVLNHDTFIDNGLTFAGNGKDIINFFMEDSLKNNFSWGGGDTDTFIKFTATTEQSNSWVMDFNFSPTEEGGDKITFFEEISDIGFSLHEWTLTKTQLVPRTADESHPFLSDEASYYELKVQSSIDLEDTNWYSVFNLVGIDDTQITLAGLIANGNLVYL